ncbi:MAG TPA: DUF3800 domain-containing protein, partial [Thermoanaerobaculia bacterium]
NLSSGGSVNISLDRMRKSRESKYGPRIGSYNESDRKQALGLQAADLLAYAAFRHASGNTGWQWNKLRPAIKATELTTSSRFWARAVERFEAAANDPKP